MLLHSVGYKIEVVLQFFFTNLHPLIIILTMSFKIVAIPELSVIIVLSMEKNMVLHCR